MSGADRERVLIVTGVLNPASAEWRKVASLRARLPALAAQPWYAVGAKSIELEYVTLAKLERCTSHYRQAAHRDYLDGFFPPPRRRIPNRLLTEVSLMTCVHRAGLTFESTTFSRIAQERGHREALLDRCATVFISTTYLGNLTDLHHFLTLLKRPTNRLVVGGGWVSIIHDRWREIPEVDVAAMGYGELTVPSLAAWIRSGYQVLPAPETGRVVTHGRNSLLYSGAPPGRSLDDLDSPDWELANRYHGHRFEVARYESQRGCPYRCGYCNYPFLYDDDRFRLKSAPAIVADWERLAALGVRIIDCVDALFTVPKQRLEEICRLLLERDLGLEWFCFARAGDLSDPATAELMYRAGCRKIFIGVESGSQKVLDNMNKRCTVAQNATAIQNGRRAGIMTVAGIIVGYPGDNRQQQQLTLEFLRANAPDQVVVAPFTVASEKIPVTSPEARERFGLATNFDGWVLHPYWRHDTMDCAEAVELAHWLIQRLKEERISVVSNIVLREAIERSWIDREPLLDFQRDLATRHRWFQRACQTARRWALSRLRRDLKRTLPS